MTTWICCMSRSVYFSQNVDIKDLGDAFNVTGIEIHRDRRNDVLVLSQKTYIEHIFERNNFQHYTPTIDLLVKGDVCDCFQSPIIEIKEGANEDDTLLISS